MTRELARQIFHVINDAAEDTITLDFSDIEFASHSFFDELHSLKVKTEPKKQTVFTHLNRDLQAMLNVVTKRTERDDKPEYDLHEIKVVAI